MYLIDLLTTPLIGYQEKVWNIFVVDGVNQRTVLNVLFWQEPSRGNLWTELVLVMTVSALCFTSRDCILSWTLMPWFIKFSDSVVAWRFLLIEYKDKIEKMFPPQKYAHLWALYYSKNYSLFQAHVQVGWFAVFFKSFRAVLLFTFFIFVSLWYLYCVASKEALANVTEPFFSSYWCWSPTMAVASTLYRLGISPLIAVPG